MLLFYNFILIVGVSLIIFSSIILSKVDDYLQKQVAKNLVIEKNSPTYDQWISPKVPIHCAVYLFNLTNPDEFLAGKRPILEEKGPYIFEEKRDKFDINYHQNGNQVFYYENRSYFFSPELTHPNSLNDQIIFPNVPALALGNKFILLPKAKRFFFKQIIDAIFESTKTVLIEKHSAGDIIDGLNISFAGELNKALELANLPLMPEKFGIFYEKNNTNDGSYQIDTGKGDINQLNNIVKYNGNETFNTWKKNSECDIVKGTDGSGFAPQVDVDSLEVFNSNLCRTFKLDFQKIEKIANVKTRRYAASKALFESPLINSDNACYCLESDLKLCNISGIVDLSTCIHVDGLFASSPHFYEGDDILFQMVLGMHPDKSKHSTFMNVEPITGKTFAAAKRVQLTVKTPVTKEIKLLSNLTRMFYPFAWLEESFVITDNLADEFKSKVIFRIQFTYIILYISLCTSIAFILIGLSPRIRRLLEKSS